MKSIADITAAYAADSKRQTQIEAEHQARIDRERADRRRYLRKRSMVPDRFRTTDLDRLERTDGNAKALDAAMRVRAGLFSQSIALYGGDVGSGKTAIAAALVNAANDSLVAARMLTIVTLVDQMHEASKFGSDEDVTQIVADFGRTPVLLLDDLGREPVTRRSIPWLYELLNRRWNANRPLILTTNLSFDGLVDRYAEICARAGEPESTAEAIVDRLRGLVPLSSWFEVSGASRRGRQ